MFGKYMSTSGRPGFVHPFDLNLLSTVTRKNIEKLMKVGWKFDKIIISPVKRTLRTYKEPFESKVIYYKVKHGYTFVIIGKDFLNRPVAWVRKETGNPAAGQTIIQWLDHQQQAAYYLDSVEFKKDTISSAEKRGDWETVASGVAELV